MNEIDALQRALASPIQSGKSPMVTEYEEALAAHFGSGHAISVNSGSAAIQTTLATLGARPGKTVLVSAAAPLPSLLPIAATGATPRFVDCPPRQSGDGSGCPVLSASMRPRSPRSRCRCGAIRSTTNRYGTLWAQRLSSRTPRRRTARPFRDVSSAASVSSDASRRISRNSCPPGKAASSSPTTPILPNGRGGLLGSEACRAGCRA